MQMGDRVMNVIALGYLGLESARLGDWQSYCTEFLGMMDVTETDGHLRFRVDERSWRISVQDGPQEDVAFVGLEAVDSASLEAICENLNELGYQVSEDPALAIDRQVSRLFRVEDPDGLQVELFAGPLCIPEIPFASPVGVSKFVTGELGLGHFVLFTPNIERMLHFYQEGLGFETSDTISLGPIAARFLHCNPRHHSVAMVEMEHPKKLAHFMLETGELDDVGFAIDRANEANIPITMTFGRHTNDHMLSFYAQTPSGSEVEFGCGGRLITDSWAVAHYVRTSIWGHKQ